MNTSCQPSCAWSICAIQPSHFTRSAFLSNWVSSCSFSEAIGSPPGRRSAFTVKPLEGIRKRCRRKLTKSWQHTYGLVDYAPRFVPYSPSPAAAAEICWDHVLTFCFAHVLCKVARGKPSLKTVSTYLNLVRKAYRVRLGRCYSSPSQFSTVWTVARSAQKIRLRRSWGKMCLHYAIYTVSRKIMQDHYRWFWVEQKVQHHGAKSWITVSKPLQPQMGLPWQPKDLISQHFLSWCWLHSMAGGVTGLRRPSSFNSDTDPQMWNLPEVDVLRVAFQILKEQRVSTVRESWQFWGIESVWTLFTSTSWLIVQGLRNRGCLQSHVYLLAKTNRRWTKPTPRCSFFKCFSQLFPHCVALVSKLVWTLKPALLTYRMSSKLQTGEFSMSSWRFEFLAEIWAAKGILFLVTSKRRVSGRKAAHFQLHQSWVQEARDETSTSCMIYIDAMKKRTCSTRLHSLVFSPVVASLSTFAAFSCSAKHRVLSSLPPLLRLWRTSRTATDWNDNR